MALHKDKFEYMCHKFNHQYVLSELPFVVEYYKYSVSKDTTLEPMVIDFYISSRFIYTKIV